MGVLGYGSGGILVYTTILPYPNTLLLVVHTGENPVIFEDRFLTFAASGAKSSSPTTTDLLHVENFNRNATDAATPGD
jgi:hypothetical protein